MAFGDRLREHRQLANMKQSELAEKVGLTLRSIQNYESNTRYPVNMMVVKKLADALGVTIGDLLEEFDYNIIEAGVKGGSKAQKEVFHLVNKIRAMFTGNELDDDDKDAALRALIDAYWDAKKENKKYTPYKYRQRKELEQGKDSEKK